MNNAITSIKAGVILAAKSNTNGQWECIAQHHKDTAEVMKYLCDPDKGWISASYIEATGIAPDIFICICVFLAATHDIGKITPLFQARLSLALPGLEYHLAANGFNLDQANVKNKPEIGHAFISGVILHEIYGLHSSACEVAAAHHGVPRGHGRRFRWNCLKRYQENIAGYGSAYKDAWDEAVSEAERIAEIRCCNIPELPFAAQILISGLLIMADWIASNESFFPLADPWDTASLLDAERGIRGYKACGIRRGWIPSVKNFVPDIFYARFGWEPNDLQMAAGKAAESGAKIMIIESSMGTGKTEAALMSAEIMATLHASSGLYIGLPTQATANGIFPRIMSWIRTGETAATVNLAHGGAKFNDDFNKICKMTFASGKSSVNTNDESDNNGLYVNKWMLTHGLKLMSDYAVGTADQALFMTLNTRFFMLLHMQLVNKVVIIDEVHAYDAYTDAYLDTAIAYFGLYHCPVILLSATLTEEKKTAYIKSYTDAYNRTSVKITDSLYSSYSETDTMDNNTADVQVKLNKKFVSSYPCISWWDEKKLHVDKVSAASMPNTRLGIYWMQDKDLAREIKSLMSAGGCAGIIRNTIGEAVRTYRELKRDLPGYRIILMHSRFLMDDRACKERNILEHTGKGSTPFDRDKLIVIGTQVLEQSLDNDYDVLFIDPCPMDLLLQRAGRLHRHIRARPDGLQDAKLYLLKKDGRIVGCGGRPYDDYIMNRTCEVLSGLSPEPRESDMRFQGWINLPDDIKKLVEKTYDLSEGEDSAEKKQYMQKIDVQKLDSRYMRIPDPWNCESIQGLAQCYSSPDEEGNKGVRQGDSSRSVIMLVERNGVITDVAETVSCAISSIPDERTSSVFSRQVIRIPGYMLSDNELKAMRIRTGFGNTAPWLYRDILLLDENCTYTHVTPAGKTIRYEYSRELGLAAAEEGGSDAQA